MAAEAEGVRLFHILSAVLVLLQREGRVTYEYVGGCVAQEEPLGCPSGECTVIRDRR